MSCSEHVVIRAQECLDKKEADMVTLKTSQLSAINDKCLQVEQLKLAIEHQLMETSGSENKALRHQVHLMHYLTHPTN